MPESREPGELFIPLSTDDKATGVTPFIVSSQNIARAHRAHESVLTIKATSVSADPWKRWSL
jgi:hypothetical protein